MTTITCEAYQWQGDSKIIPQWVAAFMRASDLRRTNEDLILYTFDGRYELGTQRGEWLVMISGCLVVVATLPEVAAPVTPAPSPTPTAQYPQPYEPIDHEIIGGVDYVIYYASGEQWRGVKLKMTDADWKLLNPAITTGLH